MCCSTLFLLGSASAQQITTVRLGVFFVQFADSATNLDSRGAYGYIDTNSDHTPDLGIENKYRYSHYWNHFFDSTGSLTHPDYDSHRNIDPGYFANRLNLEMLGGVRHYYNDISYGALKIVPGITRQNESGIINQVGYSGSDPSNGIIRWEVLVDANNTPLDKSAFTDPGDIRPYAMAMLANYPGYDASNYDMIYVIFAGGCTSYCVGRPGISPATYGSLTETTTQFASLATICHEIGHQLGFTDLSNEPNKIMKIGHLSLMGQPSPFGMLIPPHLDPWHKLRKGWIDYVIVNNSLTNVSLPIMETTYQGSKPFVYILPVQGDFTSQPIDWDEYGKVYYIIENRRATGYDVNLNRYTDNGEMPFATVAGGGGFVIWEYQSGGYPLRIVEADGDFELTVNLDTGPRTTGSPEDFFALAGPQYFAPWTFPNNYCLVADNGVPYTNKLNDRHYRGNPIVVKLPEYVPSGASNPIDLLSTGDRYTEITGALANNSQRKLASHNNALAMAHVSEGLVFLSMSTDAGSTWDWCELVSDISYNGRVGSIPQPASAPSVGWIEDEPWVAYQQESATSGLYDLHAAPGWRQYSANVTLATAIAAPPEGPLPAIASGFTHPDGSIEGRVYYSTTDGIKYFSWDPVNDVWSTTPISIASTDLHSIRPAVAMSASHIALLYEQKDPTSSENSKLYLSIDDGAPVCITDNIATELFNHSFPSISIAANQASLAWMFKYNDRVAKKTVSGIAHAQINVTSLPSAVFTTTFLSKYDRDEYPESPVIAAQSDPKSAAMAWSVYDQEPGARFRRSKYQYTPRLGKYMWDQHSESPLSSLHTYCPAIEGIGGDARFVIARGDEPPYALHSSLFSTDYGPESGKIEVGIEVGNLATQSIAARISLQQPELVSGGQTAVVLSNVGIPDSGFVRDASGPSLSQLLATEDVLMHSQDYIAWALGVAFDSSYTRNDTVYVRGLLLDAASGQVIGSSNIVPIDPLTYDSSISIGFELPPSHYPEAEVKVSLELIDGPDADPNRSILAWQAMIPGGSTPKAAAQASRADRPAPLPIQVYPNPVMDDDASVAFFLDQATSVRIEIRDILGRVVHVLSDQYYPVGHHVARLTSKLLPAGLYSVVVTGTSISGSSMLRIVH